MVIDRSPQEFEFDLSGGHPALDFANTVSRRDSPEKRVDHIGSFQDLISFAGQSRLISSQQAEALGREAQVNQRGAAQALRKALSLRETLFRTFLLLAGGKPASSEDIGLIEKWAVEALRRRRIERVSGGYTWEWDTRPGLERVWWPIAQSAAELLTSGDLTKVRECEAPDCEWLFLDTSRNHSRRWCAMTSCGNRAKARRHYHRQHGR